MVMCNGAGEIPGQEGEGSYDDNYTAWIEKNEEYIIDKWIEQIGIDDVDDNFISNLYDKAMGD